MSKLKSPKKELGVKYVVGYSTHILNFADGLDEHFTFCVMKKHKNKELFDIIFCQTIKNTNQYRNNLPSKRYIEQLKEYYGECLVEIQ